MPTTKEPSGALSSPIEIGDASPSVSRVTSPRPAKTPGKKDDSIGKPVTKSQNLKQAREDISEMLSEYKCMQSEKREDKANKRLVGVAKEKLNEEKVKEVDARRTY